MVKSAYRLSVSQGSADRQPKKRGQSSLEKREPAVAVTVKSKPVPLAESTKNPSNSSTIMPAMAAPNLVSSGEVSLVDKAVKRVLIGDDS